MKMNNSGKMRKAVLCNICNKIFSTSSSKNRHMRKIHKIYDGSNQIFRIICPLCSDDKKDYFITHILLVEHLTSVHSINIKKTNFTFATKEELDNWMLQDKKTAKYVTERRGIKPGYRFITYSCNRSNLRGYQGKRKTKTGGSIKINGVCPSRIIVKIYDDEIQITFFETHVGHENELRSQRITKMEQEEIANKLKAGISMDRILKDARQLKNNELQKINLINKDHLRYLRHKLNIEQIREQNDMIAVAMKVGKWNADGNNYAFLFKRIGEPHPKLKEEDFAFGFMNASMERKLKEFQKVISINETQGTRKFKLTVMQIKDNQNAGAFFLSNRQDQIIQEIYLESLKKRLEQNLTPEYLMTDDDGKFFNAWVKVMGNTPRRLLCTWDVIKNWRIQGKIKITNEEMKEKVKHDLAKIMAAINKEILKKLTTDYFKKLEEAKEMEFLNYLKQYYFQNEERIQMWSCCYRMNAGNNINMALEKLNEFLDHNLMEGSTRITVKELLNVIDKALNEKKFNTITNMELPISNNYQDEIIGKAQREAEGSVEATVLGKCKIKFLIVTSADSKEKKILLIKEQSNKTEVNQKEIVQKFADERCNNNSTSRINEDLGEMNDEIYRKNKIEEMMVKLKRMDNEKFKKCVACIEAMGEERPKSRKRKIDTQTYYHQKKKKTD